MRKALGGLVLVAGVGGLGWYGSANNARDMEAKITGAAAAIAAEAPYGVTAAVAGRDVTVTGNVGNQTELEALRAAFDGIDGRRVVNLEAVAILPEAQPFEMSATYSEGAWGDLTGAVPSEDARTAVAAAAGSSADDMVLSTGAPGGDWAGAVSSGLLAGALLDSGTLTLSDDTLTLAGMALTPAEKAAAEASVASDLPEGFSFVSNIDTLDDGLPLTLVVEKTADSAIIEGKLPADLTLDDITPVFASTDTDGVRSSALAAANADWPQAATQSVQALTALINGRLYIEETEVFLDGVATPEGKADAEALLASLPGGFSATPNIELFDDGAPFSLSAVKSGEGVTLAGKLPADLDAASLVAAPASDDTVNAFVEDDTGIWPDIAVAGMAALNALDSGTLEIVGNALSITGTGMPDGVAAAQATLAGLSGDIALSQDIQVADDGAPFSLLVTYDGAAATTAGKLPAGISPEAIDAAFPQADLSGTYTQAFIADEAGLWPGIAETSLAALGRLEDGALSIIGNRITLTGTATTPDVEAAIEADLATIAGAEAEVLLDFIDDGTPPAWTVDYTAADGADVTGKLPSSLTGADIAGLLGLDTVTGEPTQGLVDADTSIAQQALSLASEYLPETEVLTLSDGPDGTMLDLTVSPGVNDELVALDLSERMPIDVALTVGSLDVLPTEGDIRIDRATGLREMFRGGNWLPILTFAATLPTCDDAARNAIEASGINFLSGSAQLDAKSVRAINTLAAIVDRCVSEAPLQLEIGGHTDSSGDDALNQALSEDRAGAVREALIARGIPGEVMVAVGYGESQPIADNETEEGKAANRRTEITWSERAATSDNTQNDAGDGN